MGQYVAMKIVFSIVMLNMSLFDASYGFLGSWTAINDNLEKGFSQHLIIQTFYFDIFVRLCFLFP